MNRASADPGHDTRQTRLILGALLAAALALNAVHASPVPALRSAAARLPVRPARW